MALITASSRFTRLATALSAGDLPSAVIRALSLLDEYGELRITEFARLDRCSQPAATALIGRLAGQGLADRRKDPDDSRAVVVGITPAGRDELAKARTIIGDRLAPYFDDVDPQVLERVRAGLDELHDALKREQL